MAPISKKIYPTTSSEAIVWEGEDLPCIKLCKGDTVSDVVFKLALELCKIKTDLNLKDIDLKCIFEACQSCPVPDKTLGSILELIITKVCSIDAIVRTLNSSGGSAEESLITVASCFLPLTNSQGDPVTKLIVSDYVRFLATAICSLKSNVTSNTNRLDIAEEDIAQILSALNTIGDIPKVQMNCVGKTNTPIDINDAVVLLETEFCKIKSVLGESGEIAAGIGKQPTALSSEIQLGSSGPMSTLVGWEPKVETIADSLPNLWLTIIDMRGAVKAIQDNCCKVNCDSIKVDFDIKLSDDRTIVTLFFAGKSKIPVGFSDVDPLGNILHITDSNGALYDARIKIAVEAADITGIEIDLSGTPIDPLLDYFFQMDSAITNGGLTCQKCINKTATYKNTCSFCEISVTGHTSASSSIIIVYTEPSSIIKKYLEIKNGETKVISKSNKILEIMTTGSPTYTSSCGTLPEAVATKCYKLDWSLTENGASSTQAWDIENTGVNMQKLIIAGTEYNAIGVSGAYGDFLKTFIAQNNIPVLLNVQPTLTSAGLTGARAVGISFQTIPSIAENMYLSFRTSAVESTVRFYPAEITCPSLP